MDDKIIVICEGSSDVDFLHKLFAQRNVSGIGFKKIGSDDGGNRQFEKHLRGIATGSEFPGCKLVAVVADNDDDPAAQFGIVKAAIAATGYFGIPDRPREVKSAPLNPEGREIPKVVVLMLPSDNEAGGIEALLLKSGVAKNKAAADCIDSYVCCAKADTWSVSHRDKLRARIMLSTSAESNPNIPFGKAWESQSGNPFPLDHEAFDGVVDFFNELLATV